MTRVILDCLSLRLYPLARPGFHGATETYAKRLAAGLAARGHEVHVVAPDLADDEQRGEREHWWPASYHPSRADVVVCVHSLAHADQYAGDALVVASNGADVPGLEGTLADLVAAWPVFSRTHGELLCRTNPTIKPERCVLTGLGVDLDEYPPEPVKVPARMWVGNDPARGLANTLDIFDRVKQHVPEATLRISYDFAAQFERLKWHQNAAAETFWECRRRLGSTAGVSLLGTLERSDLVTEQLDAMVHVWPSDPANVGTQLHGVSQMEAAAAGCALVLSDVEAFPEVFGTAAEVLPVVGRFLADPEGDDGRRIDAQDYADVVIELLRDPDRWREASRRARRLAEQHTWEAVIGRWCQLLEQLMWVPA